MNGVEINSSFYRHHAAGTYARWAAATPHGFRFALKVPRLITHEHRLQCGPAPLERFLDETSALQEKRGPLLVQLPPSFAFDTATVNAFFETLRARYQGAVVVEPRHQTWWTEEVNQLLVDFNVARVAADPPRASGDGSPGGSNGIVYFRLHGSPRTYWSRYSLNFIGELARSVRDRARSGAEVWCVFDNTAAGAAMENAWEVVAAVGRAAGLTTATHGEIGGA
jgi:uncharacterized protein YecE (DUF72 family)